MRFNLPREEAFSLRRLWVAFKEAGWALTLPVIILGGIFGGFVTATEGAGLAVVAALVIGGLLYRELNFRHLIGAMIEGVMQTAVVMLLVATSACLGHFLTEAQVPQTFAQWVISITDNKYAVLGLLNVMLFIVGMFIHGAAAIILVVPIVLPLIQQMDINPIQFGLMMTLNIAVGQQTPPVASVLVTSCSIAKNRHLGDHKDKHTLYRGAAVCAFADHLCAGGAAVPGGAVLPISFQSGYWLDEVRPR